MFNQRISLQSTIRQRHLVLNLFTCFRAVLLAHLFIFRLAKHLYRIYSKIIKTSFHKKYIRWKYSGHLIHKQGYIVQPQKPLLSRSSNHRSFSFYFSNLTVSINRFHLSLRRKKKKASFKYWAHLPPQERWIGTPKHRQVGIFRNMQRLLFEPPSSALPIIAEHNSPSD